MSPAALPLESPTADWLRGQFRDSEGEHDGSSDGGRRGRTRAGTGSKTIADLLPLAVEKYGDAPAQRYKVGDEWQDISYARARRAPSARSRSGWSTSASSPATRSRSSPTPAPSGPYACFGILTAGATLVTIYQTNSPEECQYVLSHSDSRAVFVEDAEQLAKIREIEERLPRAGARDRDGARRRRPRRRHHARRTCASAAAAATQSEWQAALRGRHARRHVPLHLHVGHHRPAQGLPALARQLPRDHRRGGPAERARGRRHAPTSSSRSRTPSRS